MARSGVSGGFKTLDLWVRKIDAAGGPAGLRELSGLLAEEAIDLVAEGFKREADPYDKRWPGKRFGDGRQVLVGKTARLRRGWHSLEVSARGFRIAPSVNYARYHQSGTGIHGPRKQRIKPKKAKALAFQAGGLMFARSVAGVPPRKMVPDKGNLPLRWRKALVEVAREYFHEKFG